jgi:hypothetical protein
MMMMRMARPIRLLLLLVAKKNVGAEKKIEYYAAMKTVSNY